MEYRNHRIEYLKSHAGWLNLAGLYWMDPGDNSFGSDSSNKIIFPPQAPADMGYFTLSKDTVTVHIHPGINVTCRDTTIRSMVLASDITSHPDVLHWDSLAWFVIKRGLQTGIRLRDYANPALRQLDSIPAYPPDLSWRFRARFIPYDHDIRIQIPNVLGTFYEDRVPGILSFHYQDKTWKLVPTVDNKDLFVIFADETSGRVTYGGGRFLKVEQPDKKGYTWIDFNKAYNPPCAFTPYATCPLPPKENILPFAVTAGEKMPEHIHGHRE